MQAYLVLTEFGIFIHDSDGKIIRKHLTYPDREVAWNTILRIMDGTPTEPLRELLGQAQLDGYDTVIVDATPIAKAIDSVGTFTTTVDEYSREIKMFRSMLDDILADGVVESETEIRTFRRDVALALARAKISEASKSPDLLVKHAIDAIAEIDKNINVEAMRLREWFSLFRPSLTKLVEDHEQFARVIKMVGVETPTRERLVEIGIDENLSERIISSLETDMGAPITREDLAPLMQLADVVQELTKTRSDLEAYTSSLMKEIAPNITALVGPLVGARLISMAGSLLELSRKTSSTIQILGAEKALFRSLKTGTAPPKHGVIFQVPELYSAPYWQRGKIARALSGKLSIAARIDAFSKRDLGQELREAFEKRVRDIREQNPEPPPPKAQTSIKDRPRKPQSRRYRRGKSGKRRTRKR